MPYHLISSELLLFLLENFFTNVQLKMPPPPNIDLNIDETDLLEWLGIPRNSLFTSAELAQFLNAQFFARGPRRLFYGLGLHKHHDLSKKWPARYFANDTFW